MGLFSKKKTTNVEEVVEKVDIHPEVSLTEGKIMDIAKDGFIDTSSYEALEKFKHNLKLLAAKVKEENGIDKFYIIREDDKFPTNMEWDITGECSFDLRYFPFTKELKEVLVEEKLAKEINYNEHNNDFGFAIPYHINDQKKLDEEVSKLDNDLGKIYVASKYRSTKHFTLNTPLEATASYNTIPMDRNYIVIDNIKNFLDSGYGYSISYKDTFLDVSHEPLKISSEAIILVSQDNYDKVITDEIKTQIGERRIVRYSGDTFLAVNMLLTELGVMPSAVGYKYLEYDPEMSDILENSLEKLAKDNNLYYGKWHYGDNMHYTAHYDDLVNVIDKYIELFRNYLIRVFPESKDFLENVNFILSTCVIKNIKALSNVSATDILNAIENFNMLMHEEEKKNILKRQENIKNMTHEMKESLKSCTGLLQTYYYNQDFFKLTKEEKDMIDKDILTFLHSNSLEEQYTASKRLNIILNERFNPGYTSLFDGDMDFRGKTK